MIIDINCWLGHYPYRRLRHNDADDLVTMMDKAGIDQAVVSSIDAIFYKNAQSGNEELYEEIAGHRDRLIPFATINPTYAGWERDLAICHEELRMVGLRVFPSYHGYALSDPACEALLGAAAERGLPVAFVQRMVDRRQHHWLDATVDLQPEELASTIQAHPQNRFMILNSLAPADVWKPLAERDVLIGISRLTAASIGLGSRRASIQAIIASLGVQRVAFGTGMPFKVSQPTFLKLDILQADEATKEKIRWGNATRMLGL